MRSVLSSLERMRRRPLSTLLVLTLLGAVLLIGAASGTLLYDLRQLTDELQGEVGLVAYLADAAPPGRLEELARELERLPGVQRVRPVPRRLALADLRASLGEDADLIDELGPELLPDSLEVVPVPGGSPEGELAALSTRIGRLEGIATVWRAGTGRGSVARMAALLSLLQLGGGAIMLVMVALVAWIVAGVVGLAFAARSDEVHLLRLLGASESFIRRPFLLEGSLLSLTAGLLSIVGLLGLVGALRAILGPEAILAGIHLALPPPWLCAGYVLGGGLVGLLGALLGTARVGAR